MTSRSFQTGAAVAHEAPGTGTNGEITMERLAWRGRRWAFELPATVPSMISREERRYLHWLTRQLWSGRGAVVEVGPWLGGSTLCLASGMRRSGRGGPGMLHVVDNFVWQEFMAPRSGLSLAPGASFRAIFLENVRDFADLVVCHEWSLPDDQLQPQLTSLPSTPARGGESGLQVDGPIEILFIDGAKSWRGVHALLTELNDRLVPSMTYLVCQDFKCWDAFWIPIMMSRLAPFVSPVHNVERGGTVTFRLHRAIPDDVLSGMESTLEDLDVARSVEDIAFAASLLSRAGDAWGAAVVSLSASCFLAQKGELERAGEAYRDAANRWPVFRNGEPLFRARRFLERLSGRAHPLPGPLAASLAFRGGAREFVRWVRRNRIGSGNPGRRRGG